MVEATSLTKNEWHIMELLWVEAPRTLRQLTDALAPGHGWSRHAIISFLKRMEVKGTVRVDESGPVKRYYPLLAWDRAVRQETRSLVDMAFKGDVMQLVSNAVHAQDLTEDQVGELRAILRAVDRGD
jgi:BlaI family penicillinase repressor